jgi:enoyl-CoA hydratase
MNNAILYRTEGRVAIITLNRPEARNAINGDWACGMEACLDKMEADDAVWVGVLTANIEGQSNPVFCAGADLKAVESGKGGDIGTPRGGAGGFVYRERKKPIICAVWVLIPESSL